MPVKYSYSKSVDFPANKVATSDFFDEIQNSSISSAVFQYVDVIGDDVQVWFDVALSAPDKTTLDGLVAAHSGIPVESVGDDFEEMVNHSSSFGGDVSGSYENLTVTGFQTISISPNSPNDGDFYVYSTTDLKYNLINSSSLASSGITANQHKALRQLIHFVDEGPAEGFGTGSYKEVSGSLIFPDAEIWYDSPAKTKKIVEKLYTRSGGAATNITPTPITWKMYDTDGSTVLVTLTEDITYENVFEKSRIRTVS